MEERALINKAVTWLGRGSAVAAVMFGLLIGFNLIVALAGSRDVQLLEGILVGGSALLTVGGGASYLVGLERLRGPRGRSMRIGGWMLYSAGLLLPTGLVFLQMLAIVGGGPAAFSRLEEPVAQDD